MADSDDGEREITRAAVAGCARLSRAVGGRVVTHAERGGGLICEKRGDRARPTLWRITADGKVLSDSPYSYQSRRIRCRRPGCRPCAGSDIHKREGNGIGPAVTAQCVAPPAGGRVTGCWIVAESRVGLEGRGRRASGSVCGRNAPPTRGCPVRCRRRSAVGGRRCVVGCQRHR